MTSLPSWDLHFLGDGVNPPLQKALGSSGAVLPARSPLPCVGNMSASGDLGYTSGSYALTTNDAAGKPAIERGKYIEVWKKQSDGSWKVTFLRVGGVGTC